MKLVTVQGLIAEQIKEAKKTLGDSYTMAIFAEAVNNPSPSDAYLRKRIEYFRRISELPEDVSLETFHAVASGFRRMAITCYECNRDVDKAIEIDCEESERDYCKDCVAKMAQLLNG